MIVSKTGEVISASSGNESGRNNASSETYTRLIKNHAWSVVCSESVQLAHRIYASHTELTFGSKVTTSRLQ